MCKLLTVSGRVFPGSGNWIKDSGGIRETLTGYGICHILSTDAVLGKKRY